MPMRKNLDSMVIERLYYLMHVETKVINQLSKVISLNSSPNCEREAKHAKRRSKKIAYSVNANLNRKIKLRQYDFCSL